MERFNEMKKYTYSTKNGVNEYYFLIIMKEIQLNKTYLLNLLNDKKSMENILYHDYYREMFIYIFIYMYKDMFMSFYNIYKDILNKQKFIIYHSYNFIFLGYDIFKNDSKNNYYYTDFNHFMNKLYPEIKLQEVKLQEIKLQEITR